MNDGIRILLVAPQADARGELLALLNVMDPVWVAEVCVAYALAPKRAAEVRPELTILVLDDAGEDGKAARAIRAILEHDPKATLLAVTRSGTAPGGAAPSPFGAIETLRLPVDDDVLLGTIQRLTGRAPTKPTPSLAPFPLLPPTVLPDKHPGSRTIAVTGAMGEVGCTSLAVNLATTLARTSGRVVALADFELLFGAVDTLLDIHPENTLSQVVGCIDRLDSTLLKRMLCHHESGLAVLPRPVDMLDAAHLPPDLLQQTLTLLQSTFGALVLDTSKSLQTSDFIAFEAADVILVVVQLEATCVRNTVKLIECLRRFEGLAPRIQLVANRVGSIRASVPLAEAEAAFQAPIAWQIANATKTFHISRDRGVPLDVVAPRGDAQRSIAAMARALVPSLAPVAVKPQRGFFR